MKTYTIGIDFGTTKTLVAWSNPNTGRPECLRLGRERDYMPTTIAIRNKAATMLTTFREMTSTPISPASR